MYKVIKKYAWVSYLGAALSVFANIDFMQWQFYAILVPIVVLQQWSKNV